MLKLLAVVALVIVSFPAQARHRAAQSAPNIDIAAIPAYPVEQPNNAFGRHGGRHGRKAILGASAAPASSKGVLEPRQAESGVIRSAKTGATAKVASRYQAQLQALLDDFEAHGATVYYMGGWRPGRCSLSSQHPCGWAVDFCQDYRGHVSGLRDCNLPRPTEFHALVRAHGLFDGSVWCSTDYGHVQGRDSGGCSEAAHGSWGHGSIRLASMTGTVQFTSARRHWHHHRIRYARR